MAVTITDIARTLSITAGTVSRALKGDVRVKESTRLRVEEAAQSMGYVPNRAAQFLVEGRTRCVWLIMSNLGMHEERVFARAASEELEKLGYRALIALYDCDRERLQNVVRDVSSSADAALIIPSNISVEKSMYQSLRVPYIFVDRWLDGLSVPVFTSQNKKSSEKLVESIAGSLSPTATVCILDQVKNVVDAQRQLGVEAACAEHGIALCSYGEAVPVKGQLVFYGNSQSSIYQEMKHISATSIKRCSHILTWDGWVGSVHPAQKASYVVQDFAGIAKKSSRAIVRLLEGKKLRAVKTLVPCLQIEEVL